MPSLDFNFHPAQSEIFRAFESGSRFVVVAAGRRFGKTDFAFKKLIYEALKTEKNGVDLVGRNINVAYVAPTFNQAKKIVWDKLLTQLIPLGATYNATEGIIRLSNKRKIHVCGADSPDNMRGNAYSFIVLDEYAQMRPTVWTEILRATLTDCKGDCLFIGTPQGKNHFYDLFLQGQKAERWKCFTFPSLDNPFIDPDEIEAGSVDIPAEVAAQEYRATFSAYGGMVFKDEWVTTLDHPPGEGETVMAVDLSGFDEKKKSHGKTLDETAIAIAEVGTFGWYVHDIVHGRWDVRETAIRILRLSQQYKPQVIGIEKGPLKQAIYPYLVDNMKRLNVYPPIADCTHGSKSKIGRIQWALQGRLEQGRLTFKPGAYLKKVREQLADFPNELAHDDLIDALAYIDQVASVSYVHDDTEVNDWQPLDAVAGY